MIAICVALQLASTLHLMVVEHELCFEHGEAVDVAGAHSHHDHGDGHGGLPAIQRSDEAAATSRDGANEAASHEHCPLIEDRASRALVVPAAFETASAPLLLAVVFAPAAPWSLSPSALRLLAPKTSPPV